jgi:hypothetical protein
MKGAQIGFALCIKTNIPTPDGFKTMEQIKVGDVVYTENGKPCNVTKATEIMIGHKCFDVYFTDGTIVRCDANHLWTVFDLKGVERVLTTEQISKKAKRVSKNNNSRERSRYFVFNSKPIEGQTKSLKIDPYLLGVWLGDGEKAGNRITCEKKDLNFYIEKFKKNGIDCTFSRYKDQENCYYIHVQNAFNTYKGGYNIYKNKHIPKEYFSASFEQRLQLIQGLIDTDGHVMKDGKVLIGSVFA